MELDTGAAVTIISEQKYRESFPKGRLKRSSILLKTYTGERLAVVGDMDVKVQYENQINGSPWEWAEPFGEELAATAHTELAKDKSPY